VTVALRSFVAALRIGAIVSGFLLVPAVAAEAEPVPFVRLIANAPAYDGKLVQVSGVLRIEFEGNALFLNREHLEHRLEGDSLALALDREQRKQFKPYHKKYVTLQGVFRAQGRGHLYMPIGGILESAQIVREHKRQ